MNELRSEETSRNFIERGAKKKSKSRKMKTRHTVGQGTEKRTKAGKKVRTELRRRAMKETYMLCVCLSVCACE